MTKKDKDCGLFSTWSHNGKINISYRKCSLDGEELIHAQFVGQPDIYDWEADMIFTDYFHNTLYDVAKEQGSDVDLIYRQANSISKLAKTLSHAMRLGKDRDVCEIILHFNNVDTTTQSKTIISLCEFVHKHSKSEEKLNRSIKGLFLDQ